MGLLLFSALAAAIVIVRRRKAVKRGAARLPAYSQGQPEEGSRFAQPMLGAFQRSDDGFVSPGTSGTPEFISSPESLGKLELVSTSLWCVHACMCSCIQCAKSGRASP